MSRTALTVALALVFFAARGPAEEPNQAATYEEVAAKLKARADHKETPADPQTKLKQVLAELTERHGVAFRIDAPAFAADGINEPEEVGVVAEQPLPAEKNVTLADYLDKVLLRVPVPSRCAVLVRRDHLEVTTWELTRARIWGARHAGPFLPLVNLTFEDARLRDALTELAEQTEYNVVLDRRVAVLARLPVTARLYNTPADTAVTLLADMADLACVRLDNTLYVTSKENAKQLLQNRQKNDDSAEKPALLQQYLELQQKPREGGGRTGRPRVQPFPGPGDPQG